MVTNRNLRQQLNDIVEGILEDGENQTFSSYWELARQMLANEPVRRFYAVAELTHANVGIITDNLLIDISGDDEDEEGNLSIQQLNAFSSVELIEGPVEDVSGSEGARLVLLSYVAGSEVVDLHWMAFSEEEEKHLLVFAKELVDSISRA